MCEGRRSQVVLLDERRLELLIQPKLYAGELLDLVASHFHLKEKEYFGIAYPNDAGQYSWLQLDKRVLEHDFPKKCSSAAPPLVLYFRVKYFVESITQLRDSATVEAFYLQAKSLVSKGELEADSETVFQLAALVLQATYGDYVDELMFKSHLRRLPILPTVTLKEYPSISNCEEKVLQHYTRLAGQSRGDAIVNYLTIVESLPTYGQHYYEVKDKTGNHCWLGLSYRGISQYEKNDRRTATRVFLWKQLENLYFRDKKFTIEVHEARRVIHTLSSFNLYEDAIEEPVEEYDDLSNAICDPTTQVSVSRRTLAPANVTVYVWYTLSPVVTKCIWSMAISQHHFFLDRRHQKSQTRLVPCLSQIATELCRSVQSLSSAGSQSNISRSTSSSSLPSTILGGEISEESKAATIEMLTALRARKEALEEALKKKNEELKSLCLKEGELTGEIPPEIPLQPGEARPQVRRRVGTSFSISDKWICKTRNKERESLSDLELEYEIQSKIASAAFQLANDCTARKSVRKQRKLSYVQATAKLRSLELKLHALQRERKRKAAEKSDKIVNDGSESSVSSIEKGAIEDSQGNLVTDSLSSQSASETGTLKSSVHSSSSVPPCSSLPQLTVTSSDSRPESPDKCRQRHQSLQHVPFSSSVEAGGSENHVPCGWSVASSYCPGLEFDTISCSSSASALPLRTPYRNRFESRLDIEGSNLYSVPNRRASQVFDSQDDLLLSGRKSDKHSPSSNIPVGQHQYSTMPLSSSYDERLWRSKSKDLAAISSDCSSLETSFDGHSSNSCDNYFQTTCHKEISVELSKNPPKLHHFYSENSLHREEFNVETPYLDEQDANSMRKIAHVHSVPHLHEEVAANHEQFRRNNLSVNHNSHSLNQVADLINASMLRQGGKKSTSTNPGGCLSPKTKTKEWLETSLDSPLPVRKNKSKSTCDSSLTIRNVSENTYSYENHDIGLSPYPQDQSYDDLSNTQLHISHTRCPSQYHGLSDDHWASVESTSVHSCFSPVELRKKPVYDFREMPNDFASCSLSTNNSDQKHVYDNFRQNRVMDGMNGHAAPQVATLQNSFSRCNKIDSGVTSEILQPPHYPDFSYRSNADICPLTTDQHLINEQASSQEPEADLPQQGVQGQVSGSQNLPSARPSQHVSLNPPPSEVNLDDFHYNEATVVDIPQEIVESLTPCNGTSFPFSGNVEVNVVSVGHFQPYWEETKPYEISDFYKYSTKHRKPQQNSTVERTDPPKHTADFAHRQWNESGNHTVLDSSVFQNTYDTIVQNSVSCSQNEMLMNAHIAVVDRDNHYKEYNCLYDGDQKSNIVTSPQSSDGSNSFGEVGMRVSVADTFHEEMLAWYENRDAIKKATLV